MWSQICEKEAYMYTKLLLEKSANTKKEKNTKKNMKGSTIFAGFWGQT